MMPKTIWTSPRGRWRLVSDGKTAAWEARIGRDAAALPIWSANRRVPEFIRDEFARAVASRFVLPALERIERAVS
jgi:hypothetical protein